MCNPVAVSPHSPSNPPTFWKDSSRLLAGSVSSRYQDSSRGTGQWGAKARTTLPATLYPGVAWAGRLSSTRT
jgi:hypothetical protein